MARPTDWAPLAEADPVPGDPEGIRREVTHMKKVAEKLRTQAAAMEAMADCDGLKGKYADALADKARGLGRRLDLAEDRYREVKGHLGHWATDMETAQKKADRALDDAKDAQRILDKRKPDHDAKKTSDQDAGSDDPAVKRAEEDLDAARRKLNSAITFYGDQADHWASKIRSSIDDDMEDNWWNDLKAWAGGDWLGDLAEWLSDITSVLSIIAIFFPAVGVVVGILTGIVMAIHLIQALTGNGSWFDVLTDIAAFKMARNGIKAAKAVKSLQKEARGISEGLARAQTRRAATRANAASRRGGGPLARMHRVRENAAGRAAGRQVHEEPMPELTRKEKLLALGDRDTSKQAKDIRRWQNQYPDNPRLGTTATEANRQLGVARATWGASTALDAAGRIGDEYSSTYTNAKGHMTAPVLGLGSQW
ncbi:putative T7SS-secreted protein [Streptomyces sp. NPDC047043]|uniref:putative T7SS-secreted protein n=1 Tax=Streptomyces sp. NPDC047043 TaxID=3154497 RepID=UPI0033CB6473